jgi:hypothetical protein
MMRAHGTSTLSTAAASSPIESTGSFGIEVRILTVYVDKQESSGTVGMFSLPAAFVLAESAMYMFGKGSLHPNRS